LGEKRAQSFILARTVSGLQFNASDFNVQITNVLFFKPKMVNDNYPIPKCVVSNNCKHIVWGINDLAHYHSGSTYRITASGDLIYLCFSFVNRSSFTALKQVDNVLFSRELMFVQYKWIWENQQKEFQLILVGTQLDVRDSLLQRKVCLP
jgi:hypothetical protein